MDACGMAGVHAPQGITVHGRPIRLGQMHRCPDILRYDSTKALFQRTPGGSQAMSAFQNDLKGLFVRDHG